MNRVSWSATTVAAIGVAAVSLAAAQEPSSPRSQATNSADQVVITGCIQRAPQMPVGTSGTLGGIDVPPSKFVLTKATKAGDTRPAAVAQSYRLDADDSTLSGHVGHQVEITGTLEPQAGTAVTGDPAPPQASVSKLKVASVKMVAAACPE